MFSIVSSIVKLLVTHRELTGFQQHFSTDLQFFLPSAARETSVAQSLHMKPIKTKYRLDFIQWVHTSSRLNPYSFRIHTWVRQWRDRSAARSSPHRWCRPRRPCRCAPGMRWSPDSPPASCYTSHLSPSSGRRRSQTASFSPPEYSNRITVKSNH